MPFLLLKPLFFFRGKLFEEKSCSKKRSRSAEGKIFRSPLRVRVGDSGRKNKRFE